MECRTVEQEMKEKIAELECKIDIMRGDMEKAEKAAKCEKDRADMLRSQKEEAEQTIQFLKGQIEAYQYCMNCRRL